jgi:hypothetical protein
MTSYKKLENIAEACNVDVQTSYEAGHLVIELHGRGQDLRKAMEQIDGYHVRWHMDDVGALMPDGEEKGVLSLYSGRVNWAKLGY